MRITCGGIILYLCVAMTIAGQSVNAQDRSQTRSMVVSRNGIVAAESPLAAQAGARILERGGCGDRDQRDDGRGRADDEWDWRGFVRDCVRREGEQAVWLECERMGAEGNDDCV